MTLPDCSGLCLPARPGTTADLLRSLSAGACGERARRRIDEAAHRARGDERRCLEALGAVLAAAPPWALTTAFSHPLARLDAPGPGDDTEDLPGRGEAGRALSLCRAVIGAGIPGTADQLLMLPPGAALDEGLYLPHLHAVVRGAGGPVAVRLAPGPVRLTWSDGVTASLPTGAALPAGDVLGGRLTIGARAGTVPVLNCSPELRALFGRYRLDGAEGEAEAAATFSAGLSLLDRAWPTAHAAARRHLRGVLFLERRDHVRSHSDPRLPGVVLTTADSPMQIADTLCHELSHSRMNLFLERDPLLIDDGVARHASPWRPDPRPLLGVLNGVHAFLNVCHLYRRLQALPEMAKVAGEIFQRQRDKVGQGWRLVSALAAPTAAGAVLLQALGREVEALCV